MLRPFSWVPIRDAVALKASRIRRSLRSAGCLIPDNDLQVAACAVQHSASLATNSETIIRRSAS